MVLVQYLYSIKTLQEAAKNGVFEQPMDTNLLHTVEANHVSTILYTEREREFSDFCLSHLLGQDFGSFDVSPPLSVDLLPSLPADSTRNPRGTSAGSSFDGCEENSDPPLHL